MELNLFAKYGTEVRPSGQLLSLEQVTVQWNALQTNAKGCIIAQTNIHVVKLFLLINTEYCNYVHNQEGEHLAPSFFISVTRNPTLLWPKLT